MIFFLKDLLKAFLLPPGLFVISLLFGLCLLKGHRLHAVGWLLFTSVLLYLLSTPWVAVNLTENLQAAYQPINLDHPTAYSDVGAIVVLDGGRDYSAMEYQGDTLNQASLVRVRYAAKLANKFAVPVLCSGGKDPYGADGAGAALMQAVMANDFAIKNEFLLEEQSRNTKENAKFSVNLLKEKNIKKVFLVTQAWHMKRSMLAFTNAGGPGLQVVPAPTEFYVLSDKTPIWMQLMPNAKAFKQSAIALHELVGIMWYNLDQML